MTPNEFRWIAPPSAQLDLLETYQVSREFYREVWYRQELDHYCQWYQQTAKRHQQELQRMRQDLNILGWFRRNPI